MKLIFGLEIGESTVTETLERSIRYHGAHVLHVSHKCLQVRNIKVDGFVLLEIFFILVDLEDSFGKFDLVATIFKNWTFPRICFCPWWMNGMI